jgi:hypothetical protein
VKSKIAAPTYLAAKLQKIEDEYQKLLVAEVNHIKEFLKPRFYQVIVVNGIPDMHSVLPLSIGDLHCKRTSSSEKSSFAPVQIICKKPSWLEFNERETCLLRSFRKLVSSIKNYCF